MQQPDFGLPVVAAKTLPVQKQGSPTHWAMAYWRCSSAHPPEPQHPPVSPQKPLSPTLLLVLTRWWCLAPSACLVHTDHMWTRNVSHPHRKNIPGGGRSVCVVVVRRSVCVMMTCGCCSRGKFSGRGGGDGSDATFATFDFLRGGSVQCGASSRCWRMFWYVSMGIENHNRSGS